MPRRRSWIAVAREKASCACFEAEYGPEGGNATTPATETTLTTSAGRGGLEAGQERAQAPDAAEVVRADDGLDRLRRGVEEARPRRDARVVHEQVHERMPLEHAGRGGLDRGAVGDVAQLVLAAGLLGERAQRLLAPCEQHAVPAAPGELPGQLRADPGRGPRDDADAAQVPRG